MDYEQKLKQELIGLIDDYINGRLLIESNDNEEIKKDKIDKAHRIITMIAKSNPFNNLFLRKIKIDFVDFKNSLIKGKYEDSTKTIKISNKLVDDFMNDPINFFIMLDVVGHELRHYLQYSQISLAKDPERTLILTKMMKKNPEEYFKFKEISKKLKNETFVLSRSEYYKILSSLKFQSGENRFFEDFKNKDRMSQLQLCEDIEYSKYFQSAYEEDARNYGYDFSLVFLEEILKESNLSDKFEQFIRMGIDSVNMLWDIELGEREEVYPVFKEFDEGLSQISYAELLNSEENYIEFFDSLQNLPPRAINKISQEAAFSQGLAFLTDEYCINKSPQEMFDFLIASILTNGTYTLPFLINRMYMFLADNKDNPDFNEKDLKDYISEVLVRGEVCEDLFYVDFSLIFNEKEIASIIEDLFAENKTAYASNLFDSSSQRNPFNKNEIENISKNLIQSVVIFLDKFKKKDNKLDLNSYYDLIDMMKKIMIEYEDDLTNKSKQIMSKLYKKMYELYGQVDKVNRGLSDEEKFLRTQAIYGDKQACSDREYKRKLEKRIEILEKYRQFMFSGGDLINFEKEVLSNQK